MKSTQIFTPKHIVNLFLEEIDSINKNTTFLEPSFGDGEILYLLIKKIINSNKIENIEEFLNNNIYGIELDTNLFNYTKRRLNNLLTLNNIEPIKWKNLYNQDFLLNSIDLKFDYIIGNPPYKRVKNIYKKFVFSKGVANLYILFFEKSIKMLKSKNGKLLFITPNSYLKNKSQHSFRKYLLKDKLIEKIINFKSFKVFNNVGAYTAITILSKKDKKYFKYIDGISGDSMMYLYKNNIDLTSLVSNKEDYVFLENIKKHKKNFLELIELHIGIATNKDNFYVGEIIDTNKKLVLFKNLYNQKAWIEKEALRKVYKGSSLKEFYIIFPYNKDIILKESELEIKYPYLYCFLLQNKELLLKRSLKGKTLWYEYARKQGFKHYDKTKIVIKNILKDKIEYKVIKPYEFIFQGFYFYSDQFNIEDMIRIITNKDFLKYLRLKSNKMSQGYFKLSKELLKDYKI